MKNAPWPNDDNDDNDDGMMMEDESHNNNGDDSSSHGSFIGNHEHAVATKRAQEEAAEKQTLLAQSKRRAVTGLRVAVLVVLVLTTALVSLGVYWYTSADQEADFESEFLGLADRLQDSFVTTMEHQLGAVDYLSTTITSFALQNGNSAFPNVTLPDFEIRGANARVVADSTFFRWMPCKWLLVWGGVVNIYTVLLMCWLVGWLDGQW